MKISTLIDQASKQLVDVNHVHWSREEILDYINLGLSSLVIHRPDVARKVSTVAVGANSNLVPLPVNAYTLVTINHVSGMSVAYVDINKLGQLNPGWRLETGVPCSWTRNEFDEDIAYLYPMPDQAVTVEVVYSESVQVSSENADFPVKDIFSSVIFDYVLYRAFNKDGVAQADMSKAQHHLMLFNSAIGAKNEADAIKEQILQRKEQLR